MRAEPEVRRALSAHFGSLRPKRISRRGTAGSPRVPSRARRSGQCRAAVSELVFVCLTAEVKHARPRSMLVTGRMAAQWEAAGGGQLSRSVTADRERAGAGDEDRDWRLDEDELCCCFNSLGMAQVVEESRLAIGQLAAGRVINQLLLMLFLLKGAGRLGGHCGADHSLARTAVWRAITVLIASGRPKRIGRRVKARAQQEQGKSQGKAAALTRERETLGCCRRAGPCHSAAPARVARPGGCGAAVGEPVCVAGRVCSWRALGAN